MSCAWRMREKSARSRVEWPMVKTVAMVYVRCEASVQRLQRFHHVGLFAFKDGAQIEQYAAFFHSGDNRRTMQTQTRGQLVSSEMTGGNRQQKCRQCGSWRRAAADQRVSGNHFHLQFISRPELRAQPLRTSANLFGGHPHHPHEWNRIRVLPDMFKQRCFERDV